MQEVRGELVATPERQRMGWRSSTAEGQRETGESLCVSRGRAARPSGGWFSQGSGSGAERHACGEDEKETEVFGRGRGVRQRN